MAFKVTGARNGWLQRPTEAILLSCIDTAIVPFRVVRPPGQATCTKNPKAPFDEGIRTYERGAGVSLLSDGLTYVKEEF